MEARGAAYRGEPVAGDLDDAQHETRRVVREPGVAEDLECRDAEDLFRGEQGVLENGDLARFDALGAAHADLAYEAVPPAIVARRVAIGAVVDGLLAHLGRVGIRPDDLVAVRDLAPDAVEERDRESIHPGDRRDCIPKHAADGARIGELVERARHFVDDLTVALVLFGLGIEHRFGLSEHSQLTR